MHRTILILLTFLTANTFLVCFQTFADSSKIDSLENKLKNANNKEKIAILNALFDTYISSSPEKSKKYAIQLLKLAIKKNKKEQATALNNIGLSFFYQANYKKALEYYQKALKLNEELVNSSNDALAKSGKQGISCTLTNIGIIYHNWGNYEKALEN